MKLTIPSAAQIGQVSISLSDGSGPISLTKDANGDFKHSYVNLLAGHYVVEAEANILGPQGRITYSGRGEADVTVNRTASLVVYLYRNGSLDYTSPIILSVSWISDSGNNFFTPSENGMITVQTRGADSIVWHSRDVPPLRRDDISCSSYPGICGRTYSYTAPSSAGNDTGFIEAINSANGKTYQVDYSFPILDKGNLDVTVVFAPEITDLYVNGEPSSAQQRQFVNGVYAALSGERYFFNAETNIPATAANDYRISWSTDCRGISNNLTQVLPIGEPYVVEFTGTVLLPGSGGYQDCTTIASLVKVGIPSVSNFSSSSYILFYLPD